MIALDLIYIYYDIFNNICQLNVQDAGITSEVK